MPQSQWAPGWYRNAAGNTQYWDGSAWSPGTEQVPHQTIAFPPPAGLAAPAYQPQYQYQQSNGLAVAALVLGVLGFLFGFLTSIPGIVVGHLARRRARDLNGAGSEMAMVGLVLSYVITILTVLAVLLMIAILLPLMTNPQLTSPGGDDLFGPVTDIAVEVDLQQAAGAQEVVHAETGSYTKDVSDLRKYGYVGMPGVQSFTVVSANANAYCMEATSTDGTVYHSDSATGFGSGGCGILG
ncbi:MAG: DUF4190 domain-containing protein [Actinobacteria bacterium]|nr:DUF4190 domain-containing protein [Actinomycetota bacterium]